MKKQKILPVWLTLLFIMGISAMFSACGPENQNEEARQLIFDIEKKAAALQTQINLAEFKAAISGKDMDYKKAADLNIKLTKLYNEKETFKALKKLLKKGKITENLLKKQLEIYFNEYKFHQANPVEMAEMIQEASEIQKKFNIYRAEVMDKKLTDSDIEQILINSTDPKELEETWKASKQVGDLIAGDLMKLVKKRNKAAKDVGFNNYHEMRLKLSGQDPVVIEQLFDDLQLLIKKPYAELKYQIDDYLTKRFGIEATELRPWHYQNRYFQQAPAIYSVNFDNYYKDVKPVDICTKYFSSIGLEISPMLKNSDLEPKEGKRQSSEAIDIDRKGDVRVVASLTNDEYSTYLALYEFGWGAFLKNIDTNLPWCLKRPAHFFMADAVASFFGSLSTDPVWLNEMGIISDEEKAELVDKTKHAKRLESFVFAGWSQVMYRFEKSMYENPDQDLNKLWWDLVEKYQLIARPDNWDNPDWATKAHIITHPCTYHNYMLGELLAAQMNTYIMENIAQKTNNGEISYSDNNAIGEYLTEKFFRPGAMSDWNELIKNATGSELTPDFYKNRIIY